MTATKVDVISAKAIHNNRYNIVQDVQRNATPRVTKRCLFGQPDQEELQKIWKNNLESERQRMLNKYGFDVKTEKYVGHGVGSRSTRSSTGHKKHSDSAGLCNNNNNPSENKPYKQTCMTDYFSHLKKNKDFDRKQNSSQQIKGFQTFSKKNVNKV